MNFSCLTFEKFCFNLLSVLNMSQRQNIIILSFYILLILYLLGFQEELSFEYYMVKYSTQVLSSLSVKFSLFFAIFEKTSFQSG